MQFQFCWGTYCRNGISTTQERSRGLLLISLLKQAFCWKPSLMFKIYWLCQVTNRTSFRPRQLASSINLTTGCLKRIKHRHDKLRVQKLIFLPGPQRVPLPLSSPPSPLFPLLWNTLTTKTCSVSLWSLPQRFHNFPVICSDAITFSHVEC